MIEKVVKFGNKSIVFKVDENNNIGRILIESFVKSVNALPKNLDEIETQKFWQTGLENEIGNRNCTYVLNEIYKNILTPVEKELLAARGYPINLKDLLIYACKELDRGRVDDWNDTNNLRVRCGEVFTSLIQKQIHASYNEFISKKLGGDENAKLYINPTAVFSNIINSQNVQALENINPLEELSMKTRITPIGVGGVPTAEAWPKNAMNIHNSYYGNIDPLETPDSASMGITQHLTISSNITNVRGLFGEKNKANIKPLDILSTTATFIPFIESNDGVRVTMATCQAKQAIPLKELENPAVQTGFESIYTGLLSDSFIKKSPINGKIVEITDLHISILDSVTNKIISIDISPVDIKSGQGKSGLSKFKPTKKIGDMVKKDDIIAEGANIKDGIISNGINMLVAWMPWEGMNFEDGMVISESAAKKFTSLHVEHHTVYLNPEDNVAYMAKIGDVVNKGDIIMSYSPTSYDVETLQHQRADGGRIVNIEIYSNVEEDQIPELMREQYLEFKERYGKMNGKYPITHFKDHGEKFLGVLVKFTIQQELYLKRGDKLNNRHFNKGICFSDTHQIFTNNGWKLFKDLTDDDKVLYKQDNGKAGFVKPLVYHEYDYSGIMYGINKRNHVNYLVTPEHRMYCSEINFDNSDENYKFETAKDIHRKVRTFKHVIDYDYKNECTPTDDKILLENTYDTQANRLTPLLEFDKNNFIKFLGWFISEGCLYNNVSKDGKKSSFKVIITQTDKYPDHVKDIANVLDNMGIKWCRSGKSPNFVMSHKPLYDYLKPLGKCYDKYIPEWVFHESRDCLDSLFNRLIDGDGSRVIKDTHFKYFTTSKQLASDVSRLATLLGYFVSSVVEDSKNRKRIKYIVTINDNRKVSKVLPKDYYTEEYDGKVYCVTVPNDLIYVRNGDLGPAMWFGNCAIIEDDNNMPQLPDGRIVDMVYNPLSVINRMNTGQLCECAAGLISKELANLIIKLPRDKFIQIYATILDFIDGSVNKYYMKTSVSKLKSMSDTMYNKLVYQIKEDGFLPLVFPPFKTPPRERLLKALKFLGLKPKYKLKLPKYGITTRNEVGVGYMYVQKLEHQVEKKIAARSTGNYVATTLEPVQGKKRTGGQRLGEGDLYSILGYDSDIVIDEFFGPMSTDHRVKYQLISNIVQTGETQFIPSTMNPVKNMFDEFLLAIHMKL